MINSHWKSIVAGSSSETLPVGRKTSGCDLETVLSKRDHGGQVTFLTTILFKNIVAQLFLQAGRGVELPQVPLSGLTRGEEPCGTSWNVFVAQEVVAREERGPSRRYTLPQREEEADLLGG